MLWDNAVLSATGLFHTENDTQNNSEGEKVKVQGPHSRRSYDISYASDWSTSPEMWAGVRVVVSTAAFHARVRGSVPGLGGLKKTKMFLPHPRVKVSIVGILRDRKVACSASDRQGSNFESCVLRTVSSQSFHHPQKVLLAQFSLYVHKGGLKPDSFHFISPVMFLNDMTWHKLQHKLSQLFYCHQRVIYNISKVLGLSDKSDSHLFCSEHEISPLSKIETNDHQLTWDWYLIN